MVIAPQCCDVALVRLLKLLFCYRVQGIKVEVEGAPPSLCLLCLCLAVLSGLSTCMSNALSPHGRLYGSQAL